MKMEKLEKQENQNIPKLRFSEFSGEWEEKEIKDFGYFYYGKSAPKWSITEDSKTPCIRYGELYTKFNVVVDKIHSYTNVSEENLKFSKGGEVLVPRVGEDPRDFSKCCYLPFKGIAIGEMISVFNTQEDSLFISYYFNTLSREFGKMVEGGSVSNLYFRYLENIKLKIPKIPEQQKIANFLTAIDKRIQKLIDKKNLLENYKKGVMQQIFSQKIRFKDDDGGDYDDWEEKKLGDVCSIKKGDQLNKEYLVEDDLYPALNGGIKPSGYTNKYNTNKNTITISEGGNSCGYINFMKTKFWSGGHCYSLKNIVENINNLFLYQILKFKENKIMLLRVGSGLPNIQKRDLDSFKFNLPSLPEQQKIANFLTTLDKKIENMQIKIEESKIFKKGLLQKMFV
jgi:type I restriction enzyme S subunit